jgi:5'-phosphate synthase pdxT subunit
LPVFGTCAGLILLSNSLIDGAISQETFGGLDVTVKRNAFGSQLDSFEADVPFLGIDNPVHCAFIRAPIVVDVGSEVDVLATLPDGRIVGVRQGSLLGISFHPEVTGDTSLHEYFVSMCKEASLA